MTSTAPLIVKDEELVSYGLIESASVRSIKDFNLTDLNEKEINVFSGKENEGFINLFICHLIFYAFFCVACVVHIFIDLGLEALIKDRFSSFIRLGKKSFFTKSPAFA